MSIIKKLCKHYQTIRTNKRPIGLNGHLHIRDFTLTSCQKGSYLHINSPIIEYIKINNDVAKQHHNPINTITINVKYIDGVKYNTYSLK